ncbi:hypothetical protein [Lacticaseibacillus parakribbianus]|uniref:hypothetical protein n=1 Tax=Lacticaseibacillus parakribbianus TaxID=2970927 RepID=UPI0021CB027A|nr:hypothetical protein [Lacticaseibacillus parakribbianus]
MWWLIAAVGVVLLLALLIWYRAARKRRALRLFLTRSQQACDAAVTAALAALGWPHEPLVASTPVADVWGHGIAAFEYVMIAADSTPTRQALSQALAQAGTTAGLQAATRGPALVVTDFWLRDGLLHVDVAYLVNQATAEYVEDVLRV